MNYTTLEEAMEQAGQPVEGEALSVYRAFEQIRDGWHKRGQVRKGEAPRILALLNSFLLALAHYKIAGLFIQ